MVLEETINWILNNWGKLLLGAVVLILIFRNKIMQFFARKEVRRIKEAQYDMPPEPPPQALFVGNAFDIKGTLIEQKKALEDELKSISIEGKELVTDEKELQKYHQQQKTILTHRRQNLGLRWQAAKNNLSNVTQMIENQKKLDAELKDEAYYHSVSKK